MKNFVILGGGIVGVTTAYFLAKQGHSITIYEKNGSILSETSHANGCQLSYSHVNHWFNLRSIASIIRSYKDNETIRVCRPLNSSMIKWMAGTLLYSAKFWQHRDDMIRILDLGLKTKTLIQLLREKENISIKRHSQGILHLFSNKESFQKAQDKLYIGKIFGQKFLLKDSVEEYSHFLGHQYCKGILHKDDDFMDCHEFGHSIKNICVKNYGVKIITNASIQKLNYFGSSIHSIIIQENGKQYERSFDGYIICNADRNIIPKKYHKRFYYIKGVSMSLNSKHNISYPIIDESYRTLVTPLTKSSLRIAGLGYISHPNHVKNEDQMHSILLNTFKKMINQDGMTCINQQNHSVPISDISSIDELKEFYNYDSNQEILHQCYRPYTTNSLPITEQFAPNGYINNFHGSLGWTTSLATAYEFTYKYFSL